MYLALYRKWRPKTFDDVVGQGHITTTLKNEVINQKTAHSYLFTGSRGTGKTTCSKILAMAVNCLNPQDGNPCMECENCRGIEDGSLLDVLEIDAASNNGVEDVRILREEANYTPAQCKYRVYIIDETHMLSVSAFNALLKIMEEPPEHVKFILATTEVHKVPATVLSRCQRFDFIRIKTEDIAGRLLYIADNESFELKEDAAYLIARLADGGMRDALSILDQCTSYADVVDVDIVAKATGLVLRDYLFDLAELIEQQDSAQAIRRVDELYAKSKDLQKLVGELIEHYRNLMLAKTVQDCRELVQCLPEELIRLQEQAKKLSLSAILRSLSVLQDCLDKISRDYDKRLSVEMTLIRLCSPELDTTPQALLDRMERLETLVRNGTFHGNTNAVPAVAASVPAVQTQTAPPAEPTPPPMERPAAQAIPPESKPELPQESPVEMPRTPSVKIAEENPQEPREVPPHSAAIPTTPVAQPMADPEENPAAGPTPFDGWPEVMSSLSQNDPMIAGILAGSMAFTAGDMLFIDSPNSLFASMVKRDNLIKKLLAAMEQRTGQRYKIRIKKHKAAAQPQSSVLDDIAQAASGLGIEVHEQ